MASYCHVPFNEWVKYAIHWPRRLLKQGTALFNFRTSNINIIMMMMMVIMIIINNNNNNNNKQKANENPKHRKIN